MAKGNMLMNLSSGKLGSMIFYRTKGEQRIRTYVKTVSNPKTASQMGQRTQLSNLVTLYRVMRVVLDKAFANKKPNQSDYNAFVSRNLNKIQVFIPKPMAAAQGCVVAPYQVTDGSIAAIDVTGIGEQSVTDIFLGADFVINAQTTIAELSEAMITNNVDIVEGMQLSYLSIVQTNSVQTGYPTCTANYYKMVVNKGDKRKVYDVMPVQAVAVTGGYLGHGVHVADGAFCWILSQKDSKGQLNVSPQRLIVTSEDLYLSYTGAEARGDAGNSYGEAPDPFLNPSSTSASKGGGQMAVGSVSIDGTISKQDMIGGNTYAAGKVIIIKGTNLDADQMGIYTSQSAQRTPTATVIDESKPIADFLTDITSNATSITGKLAAQLTNLNQIAIVGNDRVLLQHTYTEEEAPDPTMASVNEPAIPAKARSSKK